jgi:hypothetical protein
VDDPIGVPAAVVALAEAVTPRWHARLSATESMFPFVGTPWIASGVPETVTLHRAVDVKPEPERTPQQVPRSAGGGQW